MAWVPVGEAPVVSGGVTVPVINVVAPSLVLDWDCVVDPISR